MGSAWRDVRKLLAREKCWQPRKPRWADRPDGCARVRTRNRGCFRRGRSRAATFAWACRPHSMNTAGLSASRSTTALRIASVNRDHPRSLWLPGSLARTVKVAFNNRTPYDWVESREKAPRPGLTPTCIAQGVRLPFVGWTLKFGISFVSSWKMFFRPDGNGTLAGTEKANPSACPAPG